MTQTEQQKAAIEFAKNWENRGDEKSDTQTFWLTLLHDVYGQNDTDKFILFEKRVKLTHTSFIDGYIPETKVLIEQKSADIDLHKGYSQSDGSILTPFRQAKRYADEMNNFERPDWIVVCNFKSFLIYNMNNVNAEPEEILLSNLGKEYYRLSFLTDKGNIHLKREMEISIKAGEIVGQIYDELLEQYKLAKNVDMEKCLASLNMLCVRLVFCLYAEDAGIFGAKNIFGDYINQFAAKDIRSGLLNLFKVLDQKTEERDPFLDEQLAAFPYVNGGLFTEEDLLIPQFTDKLKELLVTKASSDFDWSEISPTIFGAVFESTLNPETRRSGGMHYTSIENIHKVIDPLFLDELNEEFDKITEIKNEKNRNDALLTFQKKLGSLKFLDPACGSGNFLTETYLSLRRLENECLKMRLGNSPVLDVFGDEFKIYVSIHQFYGIEINDFASVVAKTALWIAESQMMVLTSHILGRNLEFLPLKSYASVVCSNALRIDWESVVPKTELNYIMGNPPFVGARLMSESQKSEVLNVWNNAKNIGNVDYVSCWYKKCADLIKDTNIKCALVSTNSITQGEQVAIMWKPLMEMGIQINFAYRTFRWDSEASLKAHVHCVIIGFGCCNSNSQSEIKKRIYLNDNQYTEAKNINGYLLDAPNIFIESRKKAISEIPDMLFGSMPNDGGNFILSKEERDELLIKEPIATKYIHLLLGAEEFINNKERFCIWLVGANPSDLRKMPEIMKRVENVREMRASSKREATKKLADRPTLFGEIRQPENGNYLLVPSTSSEHRRYIPLGFFDYNVISTNANLIIPEATLFHFGILTSNVHMAWMRAVCGRLEMRYRYSNSVVYNNFPWPTPTDEQKAKIEQTAQAILDARAKFPECSLADLYDELTMPAELRKAHQENDKAVMKAYGFDTKMTESECVAKLFRMYEELIK